MGAAGICMSEGVQERIESAENLLLCTIFFWTKTDFVFYTWFFHCYLCCGLLNVNCVLFYWKERSVGEWRLSPMPLRPLHSLFFPPVFRSGSCVGCGLRKEHGFPGWGDSFHTHSNFHRRALSSLIICLSVIYQRSLTSRQCIKLPCLSADLCSH